MTTRQPVRVHVPDNIEQAHNYVTLAKMYIEHERLRVEDRDDALGRRTPDKTACVKLMNQCDNLLRNINGVV